MKTLKFTGLMFLSLVLCSCQDVDLIGNLIINQNLTVLKETNKSPSPYELTAGEYKATAKLRDQNSTLYLVINDNKMNPTIKFDVPMQIPTEQGEFSITPTQGGQPFGLHGIIKSNFQDSNPIHQWEICPNSNCGLNYPYCQPDGTARYQRVVFHFHTTQTHYDVKMVRADNTEAGSFHAEGEYSEKVYDFRGNCL